ncbi:MAG: GMC oxidoreductase [Gemmatimonadales bacterium]
MSRVLIVGSGASGVHCAATLLERGHDVLMLDVGKERPEPVLPDADFDGLKARLEDPAGYFLGPAGESVVYPGPTAKFYGFPPSKDYVFDLPPGFTSAPDGFDPVFSFAAGGLAEAWTGGVYALNDAELADFPFGYSELEPHYRTVIRRIGITARQDDLARFTPWDDSYHEPLALDVHSALLLDRYTRRRARLQRRLGFYLGRSRVAVLRREQDGRNPCDYLGRCLWGCPRESLYAPSYTLRSLRKHPRFEYRAGLLVERFEYRDTRVTGVVARPLEGGPEQQYAADRYVLAAGTLNSSKLFLDSIYARTGETHRLPGLMDNRQLMVPFMTLSMLGRPVETHSYQFHQVALGLTRPAAEEYVHGQITALKAASLHPVVQSMPLDLRSALSFFRLTHAALGVANVWLHDRPRPGNVVTIRPRAGGGTDLVIRYPDVDDGALVDWTMARIRAALRGLGALVPPGMARTLPKGASIHYAGTVPMSRERRTFGCTAECRSHDFGNLYFADGASFPFLPAKNLTFTLMANACRIAETLD